MDIDESDSDVELDLSDDEMSDDDYEALVESIRKEQTKKKKT